MLIRGKHHSLISTLLLMGLIPQAVLAYSTPPSAFRGAIDQKSIFGDQDILILLQNMMNEFQSVKKELLSANSGIANVEKLLGAYSGQMTALMDSIKDVKAISGKIDDMNSQLKGFNESFSKIDELTKAINGLSGLTDAISKMSASFESIKQLNGTIDSMKTTFEKSASQISSSMADLQNTLKQFSDPKQVATVSAAAAVGATIGSQATLVAIKLVSHGLTGLIQLISGKHKELKHQRLLALYQHAKEAFSKSDELFNAQLFSALSALQGIGIYQSIQAQSPSDGGASTQELNRTFQKSLSKAILGFETEILRLKKQAPELTAPEREPLLRAIVELDEQLQSLVQLKKTTANPGNLFSIHDADIQSACQNIQNSFQSMGEVLTQLKRARALVILNQSEHLKLIEEDYLSLIELDEALRNGKPEKRLIREAQDQVKSTNKRLESRLDSIRDHYVDSCRERFGLKKSDCRDRLQRIEQSTQPLIVLGTTAALSSLTNLEPLVAALNPVSELNGKLNRGYLNLNYETALEIARAQIFARNTIESLSQLSSSTQNYRSEQEQARTIESESLYQHRVDSERKFYQSLIRQDRMVFDYTINVNTGTLERTKKSYSLDQLRELLMDEISRELQKRCG